MSRPDAITATSHPRQAEAGLFRNRAFMLLWAAYGVSAMGDHISEMALLKTQDAMHAPNLTQLEAMISFMFFVPYFLLGPFSGILADRLPRRGIMIFADLVRAALMFNFAVLIQRFAGTDIWQAFLPLLIVGTFAAVFSPARAALLPVLIQEDQLVRANAMMSGLGVIASMAAVLLGGYLAKLYRPQISFNVDAGTFVASAVLLAFIRLPSAERERHHASVGPSALVEGVRYIRQHARVAELIAIAVVVWMCGSVVRSTIPALVRDVYFPLKRSDEIYQDMGLFQARLGLGMLSGALVLTALGDALRSNVAMTWSLFGITLAIGTLAASTLIPMPPRWAYHLGGLAIILSGVFATGVMTSYSALMQRIIPNRIRGRVFGLTDLATIAGLLLATGLLGIPHWPRIDRWIGWILIAVALIVLATGIWSLLSRLHSRPFRARVAFWWNLNEFYCKWWFRLKREGICTVPAEGPVIVVSNHTSSIDPLLLIASVPYRPLGFMIAEEFSDLPVGGHLTRMMECIPVKRDGQDTVATRSALRHLKAGKLLGIFIQGRIARPGEVIPPKDGAAMLALHTGARVVPAHISGTVFHDSVAKSFFCRHDARVRFGKPIDLAAHAPAKPEKEDISRLSDLLLAKIQELGNA